MFVLIPNNVSLYELRFSFFVFIAFSTERAKETSKAVTRSKCELAFIFVITKMKENEPKRGKREKEEKGKAKGAICQGEGIVPMGRV